MRGIAQGPGLAAVGMPLLARWRDNGIEKNARYLAKYVPVTETGRQLSLEQVPTEGLRY